MIDDFKEAFRRVQSAQQAANKAIEEAARSGAVEEWSGPGGLYKRDKVGGIGFELGAENAKEPLSRPAPLTPPMEALHEQGRLLRYRTFEALGILEQAISGIGPEGAPPRWEELASRFAHLSSIASELMSMCEERF